MSIGPRKPYVPPCRHPAGGALRCSYCGRMTCHLCHLDEQHLTKCPDTRQRETRGARR